MNLAMHDVQRADTLLLNVAIIPPMDVAIVANELSEKAKALGGSFQIDGVTRFAHLTLYMARFKRSKADLARAALGRVAAELDQHVLEHTGYFMTAGDYYEISYARTSDLLAVHSVITQAVSPFRFNPGNPVREKYFGMYSHEQRVNAKEWGYDLAGNMYRPHMSITHFQERPGFYSLPTSSADLSFVATEIGLFEADDMGAARRLIDRIDLVAAK